MADAQTPDEDEDAAPAEAVDEPCMPCRGIGTVLSNKGGTESTVECPWCKGTGIRIPGHDAQAHWAAVEGPEAPEGGSEPPDAVA